MLRRGYFNSQYGHRLANALPVGGMIAHLFPQKRALWDHVIRHLPPPSGPDARLLDIGCGGGDFLGVAQKLGYRAVGLEPDPSAVKVALARNLDVHTGHLPNTQLPSEAFEQITLSHVLEHLHHPLEAAAELLRLLKPGGRIWFRQPNLGASGLNIFGKFWRGLEAPRHLCLMDIDGLTTMLRRVGFTEVELRAPIPHAESYFKQSVAISEGMIPRYDIASPGWDASWIRRAVAADRAARKTPAVAESLTVVARRPGSC